MPLEAWFIHQSSSRAASVTACGSSRGSGGAGNRPHHRSATGPEGLDDRHQPHRGGRAAEFHRHHHEAEAARPRHCQPAECLAVEQVDAALDQHMLAYGLR
jgi:hypothetical protein